MIYRELGQTGLKVSRLGFGCMRLPMIGEGESKRVDRELAIPMLHHAFEAGINYVDSAVMYCNHDSERALGDALKGWRDRIIVSTKNMYYGEDESVWRQNLENSLERLQVEYIDIYNCHDMNWASYEKNYEPRISKWMAKAFDKGLIHHICCSFHDKNENLIKLVNTGAFQSVTVQYNMLDRQLEEAIAYTHEKGVGVVVMGPVAGGRLGVFSPVLAEMVPGIERIPELALRFVLSNPNVTIALSGMSTMEQLDQNLTTSNDPAPLSDQDKAVINEHLVRLKAMADLYCSGCGYCMPCPNDVLISNIFSLYNMGRIYELWTSARGGYSMIGTWPPGKTADACTECGLCEEKCPQHLEIRKQLAEAHAALARES